MHNGTITYDQTNIGNICTYLPQSVCAVPSSDLTFPTKNIIVHVTETYSLAYITYMHISRAWHLYASECGSVSVSAIRVCVRCARGSLAILALAHFALFQLSILNRPRAGLALRTASRPVQLPEKHRANRARTQHANVR